MSNASRAAALASIGNDIPNIFSNVVGAYRTTKDRKEAMKDKELEREMIGYQMEGMKKDLLGKDMELETAGIKLDDNKRRVEALKQFDNIISDQKNLADLQQKTKAKIAELSDTEKSFTDAESNLAEITKQASPEEAQRKQREIAERFQFASPEMQGVMTGIKGKEDAAAETAANAEKARLSKESLEEQRKYNESRDAAKFAQDKELEGMRQVGRVNLLETKTELTPDKKPSSTQYQAATYATRLGQSENVLTGLTGKGFDPTSVKNRVIEKGDLTAIKDPAQRQYAQAARNFINANLRRESGAAIAPSEFESAKKQYFPQIGDDPETLEQKKQNRLAVMAGLKAEAGTAYGQVQQELQGLNTPKQSDLRGKYGY